MVLDLSIKEHMQLALAKAGSSITVTSVTDLIAFLFGMITTLPAIRVFCIFASVGIIFDFSMQVTFFVGWLVIDQRRIKAKRLDGACCIKDEGPLTKSCSTEPYDPSVPSSSANLIGNILASKILSKLGRCVVLAISAGLLVGLCIRET